MPYSEITSQTRAQLEHVLTAGQLILDLTKGINEHRLWADKTGRSAVERQFEVIAEAMHRIRFLDSSVFREIHDADTVIRLGDAIRRNFDYIDYGILWRATRQELPAMLKEVAQLLGKHGT
jgi:uncharacterized protein with HEPN domain